MNTHLASTIDDLSDDFDKHESYGSLYQLQHSKYLTPVKKFGETGCTREHKLDVKDGESCLCLMYWSFQRIAGADLSY